MRTRGRAVRKLQSARSRVVVAVGRFISAMVDNSSVPRNRIINRGDFARAQSNTSGRSFREDALALQIDIGKLRLCRNTRVGSWVEFKTTAERFASLLQSLPCAMAKQIINRNGDLCKRCSVGAVPRGLAP